MSEREMPGWGKLLSHFERDARLASEDARECDGGCGSVGPNGERCQGCDHGQYTRAPTEEPALSSPSGPDAETRCEKCGDPRDDEPTETVEDKGTGWKCETCQWWNWLTRVDGPDAETLAAPIRDILQGAEYEPHAWRIAMDSLSGLVALVEQGEQTNTMLAKTVVERGKLLARYRLALEEIARWCEERPSMPQYPARRARTALSASAPGTEGDA